MGTFIQHRNILGVTYLADRLSKDGDSIYSALDHIYTSTGLDCKTTKLEEGSSDPLPILAEIYYQRCKNTPRC